MAVNCSPFGPSPQFTLATGLPAAGNKLYFYAAGSSVKQDTYTDSTGLVANDNPLILNALGMPTTQIWFTEGLLYKVVYAPSTDSDPPLSPIRTWDNLTGISGSDATSSEWVAAGIVPTYINATSFTLPGDQTGNFQPRRRLKTILTAGTGYQIIISSAFSTGLTTVTTAGDALDSGLSSVSYGMLSADNPSAPITFVDALDFGVSVFASAAVNAAGIANANTYLTTAPLNGGVIGVPPGIYALKADEVALGQNVIIQGDSAAPPYDATNYSGGTVFNFTGSGNVGIRLANRSSGLRNLRLDGTGGTVKYGVLASEDGAISSVLENVASSTFQYGFALANVNNMHISRVVALFNTKVGLIVLARNSGAGYASHAYPAISSYISSTTSTVFHVDGVFRSNRIGVALLDGYCAHVNGIIEANTNYGLLVFKTEDASCDGFTFGSDFFHMEANADDTGTWNITDIEAFADSSGRILYGNHSGAWTNANPHAGVWIGSADEDLDEDEIGGPSCNIEFAPNCNISSKGNTFYVRSANKLWVNSCKPGSATGAAVFNLEQYCYDLLIEDPWGTLANELQLMQVQGGTRTTWKLAASHVRGTVNAAVSATYYNLASTNNGGSHNVDLTAMTSNMLYEYVISPSGQFLTYGARGFVYYDGTDITLDKTHTASGCNVRINANILQYQQSSGGAIASVSFTVRPVRGVSYS